MNELTQKGEQESQKFKDLVDIGLYFINYLEEEALNTESLQELATMKSKLKDQGCLSNSFNHTSILGMIHNEQLGGVGRKR